MSNPYATERFLRKQVRLRDERIKALTQALDNLRVAAHNLLDGEGSSNKGLEEITQDAAAAIAEAFAALNAKPAEGWERNV